jgi:hypothetical protein
MRGTPPSSEEANSEPSENYSVAADGTRRPPVVERGLTHLPVFTQAAPESRRVYGGGSGSDGVFANLNPKPETGEKVEEHPPVCYYQYVLHPISNACVDIRASSRRRSTPLLGNNNPSTWARGTRRRLH